MYKRRLEKIIGSLFEHERNAVVTGARQVGKSTLLKQLIPRDLDLEIAYFNFDDPDLRISLSSDAVRKLESVPQNVLVLDEVQKMPDLFDIVKLIMDNNSEKHIFLTGSSRILLMNNIHESLAGRIAVHHMYTLAFSELLDDRIDLLLDRLFTSEGWPVTDNRPFDPKMFRRQRNLLEQHQLWGGYPVVCTTIDETLRYRWLNDYKRTYLEKDIRDLKPGIELNNISRFQSIIAGRSGNLLSFSEIARDCGISVSAAQNYMKLFELSYQVHLLKPWFANQTKRMVKSPKLYYLDTGLARLITGEIHSKELSGNMYETWVFSELIKWSAAKLIAPELYFYRTAAGLEVDFLVRYKNQFLPIEVKKRNTVKKSDASAMRRFLKDFPEADRGIIVYSGEEIVDMGDNVVAVPDILLFQ